MSRLDRKIEYWQKIMPPVVAELKRQRAQAAPAAPAASTAPPVRTRAPVRFSLDPAEIEIPAVADIIDPETLSAKVIRAGNRARGELPIPTPTPIGLAAEVLNAAATARAGGPQRPAPEGLAKQILDAGRRRRGETS